MKKHIIILIIIFTTQLFAEKQIELTPIVLPYDSLNIDEVYGYGATIIARSGNTIYHSTDDGASWEIALESETKLNQLYSKDPHTVFAIGDSGLVYRTMDYGATWVDVSIDTDLELRAMAAGDYSEYMIITPSTYSFRKNGQDNEAFALSNWSSIHLQSIVKHNNKYLFSGGYYRQFYNSNRYEYMYLSLPVYEYSENKIIEMEEVEKFSWSEQQFDLTIDSLHLYDISGEIFYSSKFSESGEYQTTAGLMRNDNTIRAVFVDKYYGKTYDNDKFVYLEGIGDTVLYVTREGRIGMLEKESFDLMLENKVVLESDLDFAPVNSVSKIDNYCYYIASNNSTIYKTKLVEVQSSVEVNQDKFISTIGNLIQLRNNIELLYITNYLGQKLNPIKVGYNSYSLDMGLYFITCLDKNNEMRTLKLMVGK